MKKILSICLILIGLSAYTQDLREVLNKYNSHSIPYISVSEARRIQVNDSLIFLDSRELEEYEVSRLPGAYYIGHRRFSEENMPEIIPNKQSSIVVYCSIGVRSEQIGERLKKLGYTNVKNLYGGIFEWMNKGFPVRDKDEKLTQKIHAYSKEWGIYLEKGEKVY